MAEGSGFICKIPSREEMIRRWDDEIARHEEKLNWQTWKDEAIRNYLDGRSIPYYGLLDGTIICEATAVPERETVRSGAADEKTVELCAFRTVKAFRGKGYFSRLMAFMLEDLRKRGYTRAVVGVEPCEALNREIYRHWGFDEPAGTGKETYPDGTVIDVEYYGKHL